MLYWISPVELVTGESMGYVSGFGEKLVSMVQAHRENAELREKVLKASLLETQYNELVQENARLRGLLNLNDSVPFTAQSARVVGRDPLNWTHAVWLNRGLNDGVRRDSPVLAVGPMDSGAGEGVRGLVGRISECSGNASKALLMSDPLSSVAVSIPRIGELGLAQGQGSYITVEYLELTSQAQPGDTVVTSGQGGVFPAGLPVGTLSHVEVSPSGFRRAVLKPSVSLGGVREVLILNMARAKD
ncbi:MAG: rod shape-determining protein MreC [Elusimicrobia bacterium RIFCSPLOWO2_01_FULL_54_10]|nr:MAG: rod shape-determining protein MreC [Elusimicrobia bacterium RIFCSPLOWO2_01_FULL_54_10]